MSDAVLIPSKLATVEDKDGVRRFADPLLRAQVASLTSKIPDVTAVTLTLDTKDGNYAAVFAVQFEKGWSIAVAVSKPKDEGFSGSFGIKRVFK